MTTMHVARPPLFSFDEAMRYTTRGFDDPRYVVENGSISTALEMPHGDGAAVVRVSDAGASLVVEVLRPPEGGGTGAAAAAAANRGTTANGGDTAGSSYALIENHVRRWFDLDRDLTGWRELVRRAPEPVATVFGRLLGFRLVALPSLFEALSWCILGQQIHLAFAYRLKRRLSERYAEWVEAAGRRHHLFPTPAALAMADRDELRAMQLSYRKADYLIGLARLFRDGELSEQAVRALGDTEAMMRRLRAIRGIGEWSAAYGLLKGLGRPDAVPYGDAGLKAGCAALYGRSQQPTRSELEEFFALFPGWEGYAAFYLWRTLLPAPAAEREP